MKAKGDRQIITLTTDWGQNDYYCGLLKGNILSSCPNSHVVDISHAIPSFNINNAAFVIRHSFTAFPKGTIHLVLVNSDSKKDLRVLTFEYQDHIFIVPDNGIIGLICNTPVEQVRVLEGDQTGSFSSLNLYLDILKHFSDNQNIDTLGVKAEKYDELTALRASIDESVIIGSIIYFDSYQNAITNISKGLFDRVGQGKPYSIYVQSAHNEITQISQTYADVENGELLALFNTVNLLEVAIRNGAAAQFLSLDFGGVVRVNFKQNNLFSI